MIPRRKILIIGGNAAGAAAAAKAKRSCPDSEVTLLEKSSFISTGTCELPYLVSGEIDDPLKLVFYNASSFESEKGVKVYCNTEALEIDRRKKHVVARMADKSSKADFAYDKLVLCTGAQANNLPDDNYKALNVFNLKTLEDFFRWQKYKNDRQPRRIIVIGAGFIGLELADALLKSGHQVILTDKAALPMPAAEQEISSLVYELITRNGVEFYDSRNSLKPVKTADEITSIRIDGRFVDCDAVFVAVGVQPENRLAVSAGLKTNLDGSIAVSSKLQTSDPDIFAAGDVIGYKTFINRIESFSLAALAHTGGRIAGANAAGKNLFMKPVVRNQSLEIFGKTIAQVGYNYNQLSDIHYKVKAITDLAWSRVKIMPGAGSIFSKIIFDASNGRIYGASFFGGREAGSFADLISLCISKGIKISELDDVYYNYTPAQSTPVHPFEIISGKVKLTELKNGR